jgi:hypothetical protein
VFSSFLKRFPINHVKANKGSQTRNTPGHKDQNGRSQKVSYSLPRTGQELVMYQKEYEKQKERIAKMVENNTDAHDIRKQNEVLDETVLMLPDCKKRLTRAYKELQEMLVILY